jgi:hypothetical protein
MEAAERRPSSFTSRHQRGGPLVDEEGRRDSCGTARRDRLHPLKQPPKQRGRFAVAGTQGAQRGERQLGLAQRQHSDLEFKSAVPADYGFQLRYLRLTEAVEASRAD